MKEFSKNTRHNFKSEYMSKSGKSELNIAVPRNAKNDTTAGHNRQEKDRKQDTDIRN